MRATYPLAMTVLLLSVGCEGRPLSSTSGNRPVTGGTGVNVASGGTVTSGGTGGSVATGGSLASGPGLGGIRTSTPGSGGMASTGGVAAQAGASGGTCTTPAKIYSSNCNTPRTGIGSLSINWDYGYITGPFQGFAYVFISPSPNPSDTFACPDNPLGLGHTVPDSAWCGGGTLPADCTGHTVGGIGFNLNQPQWGYGTIANNYSQPTNPISNPATVSQVTVTFSNRANSDLRIQIAQHSDSGPIYYCRNISDMPSPVTVATRQFTKTCWDNASPGAMWDGTGAASIALIIPSQATKPTPFDACLQQVVFQ